MSTPHEHATVPLAAVSALDILASCTISAAMNISHLMDVTHIPAANRPYIIARVIATFENTLKSECCGNGDKYR